MCGFCWDRAQATWSACTALCSVCTPLSSLMSQGLQPPAEVFSFLDKAELSLAPGFPHFQLTWKRGLTLQRGRLLGPQCLPTRNWPLFIDRMSLWCWPMVRGPVCDLRPLSSAAVLRVSVFSDPRVCIAIIEQYCRMHILQCVRVESLRKHERASALGPVYAYCGEVCGHSRICLQAENLCSGRNHLGSMLLASWTR